MSVQPEEPMIIIVDGEPNYVYIDTTVEYIIINDDPIANPDMEPFILTYDEMEGL